MVLGEGFELQVSDSMMSFQLEEFNFLPEQILYGKGSCGYARQLSEDEIGLWIT